ncbi:MAG: Rnase Y domain-containing protein, partial [Desulfobacteraceae bacterium]|nr:Rnase Y domain-containing protein [Desulfobacteraceae bacterium]
MDGASILLIVTGVFLGLIGAHFFRERINSQKIKDSDDKARMIVDSAERKAESLVKVSPLVAKYRLFKMKSDFDAETVETRAELKK